MSWTCVSNLLGSLAMGDNRPTVYQEGDNWIYRASGSGSCVKYLVAMAMGYDEQRGKERDDLLQRSAAEGNLHEDAVIAKLRDRGYVIEGEQDEVEIQILPGVLIRGHREGIITGLHTSGPGKLFDPPLLFEIKSMSTKQFTKWQNQGFDAFDRYAYQISTYMEAHPGSDVLYICKRREDGYTVESTIPAGQPPIPFSIIRKKVIQAEVWRRKGQLPPCDTAQQWGCPVWYLHDEEDDEEVEPLSDEMKEVLGELVEEYRELKEIEERGKEAEKARKKINPEILNLLGKLDQTELEWKGQKYRVTRQRSGGSQIEKEKVIEIIGEDRLEEVTRRYRYEFPVIREI